MKSPGVFLLKTEKCWRNLVMVIDTSRIFSYQGLKLCPNCARLDHVIKTLFCINSGSFTSNRMWSEQRANHMLQILRGVTYALLVIRNCIREQLLSIGTAETSSYLLDLPRQAVLPGHKTWRRCRHHTFFTPDLSRLDIHPEVTQSVTSCK